MKLGYALLVVGALWGTFAWAANPVRQPTPPYQPTPVMLEKYGPDIQTVIVEVEMGKGMENPQWAITFTHVQVLLGKLMRESEPPPMDPKLLAQAKPPEPSYKGLKVKMNTVQNRPFETLHVWNGQVRAGGKVVKADTGRGLEYWLFGTARVRRDLNLGPAVLPVYTFSQCRLLGMMVVETEPRQCLLPDGGLLLESTDKPNAKSLSIHNFDTCLKNGHALIATFPRRCVVAGGRVFTEPPRVAEPPADAPLATSTPAQPTTQPATSVPMQPPSPTTISNPLLGAYAISPTEAIPETAPTLPISNDPSPVSQPLPNITDMPDLGRLEPAAGPPTTETWFQKLNRMWGLK